MDKIFYSFFFLLSAVQTNAQVVQGPDGKIRTAKSVDAIVHTLLDTADLSGLCLGIINGNKPAYVKAYGYKNAELEQKNDTATCFYAASLAKPLFAFLVMQLVREGKLDLDKPVYQYLPKPLPEYPNYKDLKDDERWKLITARHCLDHTTGFPNWRQINPHENQKLEIFFTPGSRYAYSGEGIYLLQLVIETITGRNLEALAQEKIFVPFGMQRSSFLWQKAFESDYAWGHTMSGDTLPKGKSVSANAAGSMETTIADYTRFMAGILQGKGIDAAGRNEMLSPQIPIYTKTQFPSLNTDTTDEFRKINLSYGLGWGLFNSRYGKAFFKEGHGDGWVHYVIAFPEKKAAYLILTNSASGESVFKELVEKLTGVTIPYTWEGYTPYRQTAKLPEEILKQFVGVYDGRLHAEISLVKGKLKVESATVNLPKTTLYAQNDHHMFLKIMETEMEFKKGADGKIEEVVLDDEGEHYTLKKIK